MGVIVPSYPLQLDPNTTQGLVYAMDPSGPRRTFATDTGDVADLCGNTAAGVRVNSAWNQGGPYGQYLTFGSSNYVSINNSGKFTFAGLSPFSVQFAIRNDLSATTYRRIVAVEPTLNTGWYVGISGTSQKLNFLRGSFFLEGSALAVGVWTICLATFDGTTAKLYQNGILTGSAASSPSIAASTSSLRLGISVGDTGPDYLTAGLQGVELWKSALQPGDATNFAANPNRIFRQQRNWAPLLGTKPSGSSLLLAC